MKKLIIFLFVFLLANSNADAYIGPGAGFAFVSSFFILFVTFLLAIFTFLFWPFRFLIKTLKKKKLNGKNMAQRVIIVGLDGMDPLITDRFMKEGKLPNLSKLSRQGTYRRLQTTLPSMSPVAWSSFTTGVDPSRHNIFDFLNRDLKTYMPELSSTKIEKSSKTISLGKYSVPIGKPSIRLLRKGRPFWNVLSDYGIFSSVIRVPITFPPEKLNGVLLSGMCAPDLKGSQGTFSHYNSSSDHKKQHTGGVQISVKVEGNKIKTHLYGPMNNLLREAEEARIPLEITLNGNDEAELNISDERFTLKIGVLSDWVKLTFSMGLGIKVRGICRFFIKEIRPDFQMYMTPINIDPEKPSLPVSFPFFYSVYLSKMMGSYATLGLAEDTWALNERVIDEETFLNQAYSHHQEREEMLFNILEKTKSGLCVCVFDTTDRIQHMFMRFMYEDHPANDDAVRKEKYKGVIEELYVKMDELIGKVMNNIDDKSVLMVMSDHGFKSFHRGVNLNTWLYRNGYLALKDGKETGSEWFQDIDWERTRAYTFGLSGIYVNEKGRESKGIVPRENTERLKKELMEKLRGLRDDEKDKVAIKEVYNTAEFYNGPYKGNGPDIIIGYNEGYRASWGVAVGKVEENVFEDNKKSWSGDHCIDSRLVPGIFFCNRKTSQDNHHIVDIAPTVLDLFSIEVPSYMTGKSLMDTKGV